MTRHDEMTELIGAHALGALDAAEATRLERHLTTCAACRDELAALRDVVGLLGRLDADEADNRPSPDLTDDVVAALAAERRQERLRGRRWQTALAAAASFAVLVGGIATATGLQREAPAGPAVEAAAVTSDNGVTATAGVVAHTWGVELKLVATGFEAGSAFQVEVVDRAGRASTAGAFVGTGDRRMVCNLNSAVLRADTRSFRVRSADGEVLLTAALE